MFYMVNYTLHKLDYTPITNCNLYHHEDINFYKEFFPKQMLKIQFQSLIQSPLSQFVLESFDHIREI